MHSMYERMHACHACMYTRRGVTLRGFAGGVSQEKNLRDGGPEPVLHGDFIVGCVQTMLFVPRCFPFLHLHPQMGGMAIFIHTCGYPYAHGHLDSYVGIHTHKGLYIYIYIYIHMGLHISI